MTKISILKLFKSCATLNSNTQGIKLKKRLMIPIIMMEEEAGRTHSEATRKA